MTEAALRTAVRRYIKKHRPDVFMQSFQGTSQCGLSDLLLIVPRVGRVPKYIWIELKAPGKFRVAPLQLWFRNKIRELGGFAYIINKIDSLKSILANFYNVEECI